MLKRAIHRRYVSTYRSLGRFQGNHAFHHFFLVNISPGLLSCLWPTLSMDGFLGKSVCWLMRARYWTIGFGDFFHQLDSHECRCVVSEKSFHWKLQHPYESSIGDWISFSCLRHIDYRPKSGVFQDLLMLVSGHVLFDWQTKCKTKSLEFLYFPNPRMLLGKWYQHAEFFVYTVWWLKSHTRGHRFLS